jgi:selenide,water dikinase
VVDDPRDFGAIAATNALNDVFAMGGVPLLALSITAFPEELPAEMLGEILAGADEVVRAAGAILAGGHTIRDDEPKYGLAVVGTVHPDGIWPKSGAQPGDALFLTKPLGTGLVLQAQRERRAPAGALEAAVAAMRTLNRGAADALRPFAPNAVTDVTGFGLLGHAYEMASRSGVRIELDASALPALPAALELAAAGVRTGGDRRNRDYSGPHVESGADDVAEALAFDPQTAGGLLVSLPADKTAVLEATFAAAGLPLHRIGRVVAGDGVLLR